MKKIKRTKDNARTRYEYKIMNGYMKFIIQNKNRFNDQISNDKFDLLHDKLLSIKSKRKREIFKKLVDFIA